MMTRVSACMIVRDEIDVLEEAFDSLAGFIDELVVVDTGSVDGTWELVKARADVALQHPWNDDFAEARNVALHHATGTWVLTIDADERLHVDDAAELRGAMESHGCVGIRLPVRSHLGAGRTREVAITRLFRRLPSVRYEGRIHEHVTGALAVLCEREGRHVALVDGAHLRHVGNDPAVRDPEPKHARNVRLLERMVRDDPGDAHAWYKLAAQIGPHGEGLQALVTSSRLLLEAPAATRAAAAYAPEALVQTAQAVRGLALPWALRCAHAAVEEAPDHPAAHLALALCLESAGHRVEAASEFAWAAQHRAPAGAFAYDAEQVRQLAADGVKRMQWAPEAEAPSP